MILGHYYIIAHDASVFRKVINEGVVLSVKDKGFQICQ